MSDLEDSYLVEDNPVFVSEEPPATARPASPPEQALAISDVNKKLNGFSKSASECLCKTHRLALELNHGTVSAPHLILAMTLIPNSTAQFELRKVDINTAFQAAMLALTDMERGSPGRVGARSSSEELNKIINLALEFARNRDNQEVSVDDLLTALDRLPPESAAAQLIRGGRNADPSHEMKEQLDRIAAGLGERFEDAARQVQDLAQQVQDVAQMVRFSSVETTLSRELSELRTALHSENAEHQKSVATELADIKSQIQALKPPPPEPELDGAPPLPDNDRNLEPKWLGIFGNGKA